MTDPAPVPAPPAAPAPQPVPPLNTAIPAPPPPPPAVTPPWGSEENFNAEKAWELIQNLRKEKTPAPVDTSALQQQVAALQASTEASKRAVAEAFGLTETPQSEDLAEMVKNLKSQFETSQLEATKLRLAANPGVDAEGKPLPAIPAEYHNLLTETDTEKLKSQAEMVARLVAANQTAATPPAFVPNPGQGQGGGANTPEAVAAAEYAHYYPSKSN